MLVKTFGCAIQGIAGRLGIRTKILNETIIGK
jgi:hypothetical protein